LEQKPKNPEEKFLKCLQCGAVSPLSAGRCLNCGLPMLKKNDLKIDPDIIGSQQTAETIEDTEENLSTKPPVISGFESHMYFDAQLQNFDMLSTMDPHIQKEVKVDQKFGIEDMERYGNEYDQPEPIIEVEPIENFETIHSAKDENGSNIPRLLGIVGIEIEEQGEDPRALSTYDGNLDIKRKREKIHLSDFETVNLDMIETRNIARSLRAKAALSYGLTRGLPLLIIILIMFLVVWPKVIIPMTPEGDWVGTITPTTGDTFEISIAMVRHGVRLSGICTFKFYKISQAAFGELNIPKAILLWYTNESAKIKGSFTLKNVSLTLIKQGNVNPSPSDLILIGHYAQNRDSLLGEVWQNGKIIGNFQLTRE